MLRELLKKHVPYAEITRVPHCKRDTVQKGLRFGGRHTGRSGRAEIDEAFHRPTDKSSGFLQPDCAAESRFRYYSSTASPAVDPVRPPRELQAVKNNSLDRSFQSRLPQHALFVHLDGAGDFRRLIFPYRLWGLYPTLAVCLSEKFRSTYPFFVGENRVCIMEASRPFCFT